MVRSRLQTGSPAGSMRLILRLGASGPRRSPWGGARLGGVGTVGKLEAQEALSAPEAPAVDNLDGMLDQGYEPAFAWLSPDSDRLHGWRGDSLAREGEDGLDEGV